MILFLEIHAWVQKSRSTSLPIWNIGIIFVIGGFPGGSVVKKKKIHLPMQERQETQVQSLGWEDSREKGMANYSNNLAWKILRTEECGGLQTMGRRVQHDWAHTHICHRGSVSYGQQGQGWKVLSLDISCPFYYTENTSAVGIFMA